MPEVKRKNKPRVWVGIDPGASGGMTAIHEGGSVETARMPDTEQDVWKYVLAWGQFGLIDGHVVIEKVGGYVGQNQPGSAMFKFGQSYGALRMALTAAGVPFEEVTPQAWQKALGVTPRKRDESKTQFKNRLKAKAQQLFPALHVTLAVADSLLIAEFCRRKRTGTL